MQNKQLKKRPESVISLPLSGLLLLFIYGSSPYMAVLHILLFYRHELLFHFLLPLPGELPRLRIFSSIYSKNLLPIPSPLLSGFIYRSSIQTHCFPNSVEKLLAAMAYPKSCPSFSNTYPSRYGLPSMHVRISFYKSQSDPLLCTAGDA